MASVMEPCAAVLNMHRQRQTHMDGWKPNRGSDFSLAFIMVIRESWQLELILQRIPLTQPQAIEICWCNLNMLCVLYLFSSAQILVNRLVTFVWIQ